MVIIVLGGLALIIALCAVFASLFFKAKSNEESLVKRFDSVTMLLLAIFLLLIALLYKLT